MTQTESVEEKNILIRSIMQTKLLNTGKATLLDYLRALTLEMEKKDHQKEGSMLNELESIIFSFPRHITAYTQGRTSMRSEILAVVPEEWNDITGLEGAEVLHQSIGHNAFRDKLLGKIKDIV